MRVAIKVVTVVACLLVGACSSSRDSGSGNSGSGNTGSSNAAWSPRTLAEKSAAAVRAASGFHVFGTSAGSRTSTYVDFWVGRHGARGAMRIKGRTVRIIVVPSGAYLRGPDAYWQSRFPRAAWSRARRLVHDKWVRMSPSDSSYKSVASLASFDALTAALDPPRDSYSQGPHDLVRGIGTVSFIEDPNDGYNGDVSTVFVPETGTTYPMEVTGPDGTLDFDSWNKPVSVSAPPPAQVFDPTR